MIMRRLTGLLLIISTCAFYGCSNEPSLDNDAAKQAVENYLAKINAYGCQYQLKTWHGITTTTETSVTARGEVLRPCQGDKTTCEGGFEFIFERMEQDGGWLLVSAEGEISNFPCSASGPFSSMVNKKNILLKVESIQ